MAAPRRLIPCLPIRAVGTDHVDEFTARMFEAVNGMLLDMLADDLKARLKVTRLANYHVSGKTALVGCVRRYSGRPENSERNARIAQQLRDGVSWNSIQRAEDCSRATIWKVHKRIATAEMATASHWVALACG